MVSHILYQLLEYELSRDVCHTKTNPKYMYLQNWSKQFMRQNSLIIAVKFLMQVFQMDYFCSDKTTLINTYTYF